MATITICGPDPKLRTNTIHEVHFSSSAVYAAHTEANDMKAFDELMKELMVRVVFHTSDTMASFVNRCITDLGQKSNARIAAASCEIANERYFKVTQQPNDPNAPATYNQVWIASSMNPIPSDDVLARWNANRIR
jgi:hypothetical protein